MSALDRRTTLRSSLYRPSKDTTISRPVLCGLLRSSCLTARASSGASTPVWLPGCLAACTHAWPAPWSSVSGTCVAQAEGEVRRAWTGARTHARTHARRRATGPPAQVGQSSMLIAPPCTTTAEAAQVLLEFCRRAKQSTHARTPLQQQPPQFVHYVGPKLPRRSVCDQVAPLKCLFVGFV